MYFLIGIWGGPRKEYAAIKFFLYTLFGSVLLLLAMLAFYFNVTDPTTGEHTFNMLVMMEQANHSEWLRAGIVFGQSAPVMVWMAMFIAFAIKIPMFPFHTWLPDAHVEAPYGRQRHPGRRAAEDGDLRDTQVQLPDASGDDDRTVGEHDDRRVRCDQHRLRALVAMAQTDLKRLVAYSSISPHGFVMLGMSSFTPHGINGAVFQMFNHGTITAMLFLLVGVIL